MARLGRSGRVRRYLRICNEDNAREARRVSLASIERDLRQRFVEEDPDAPVAEIEARVAAAIRRGMRPTMPPPPAPMQEPSGALVSAKQAAKAARKRMRKAARKGCPPRTG